MFNLLILVVLVCLLLTILTLHIKHNNFLYNIIYIIINAIVKILCGLFKQINILCINQINELFKSFQRAWNYYFPIFKSIFKFIFFLFQSCLLWYIIFSITIFILQLDIKIWPELLNLLPQSVRSITALDVQQKRDSITKAFETFYNLLKQYWPHIYQRLIYLINDTCQIFKIFLLTLLDSINFILDSIVNWLHNKWVYYIKPFFIEYYEVKKNGDTYQFWNKWLHIEDTQEWFLRYINRLVRNNYYNVRLIIILISLTFICTNSLVFDDYSQSNTPEIFLYRTKQFFLLILLILLNCWIILHLKADLAWLLLIAVASINLCIKIRQIRYVWGERQKPVQILSVLCIFFLFILIVNVTIAIFINSTLLSYWWTAELQQAKLRNLPYIYYIGRLGYSIPIIKIIIVVIYMELLQFHWEYRIESFYNPRYWLIISDKVIFQTVSLCQRITENLKKLADS